MLTDTYRFLNKFSPLSNKLDDLFAIVVLWKIPGEGNLGISVHRCYCVAPPTLFSFCNSVKCVGGGAFLRLISFYWEMDDKVGRRRFWSREGMTEWSDYLLSSVCVSGVHSPGL